MDTKEDTQQLTSTDYSAPYNTTYSAPYSGPYNGPPPQQPPPYYQPNRYGAATVVVGQPMPPTFMSAPVNDYMGLAIFACLCCFWPLGLFAIFKATESRESLARGDVQSAILRSNEARTYSLISIAAGVLISVGSIVAIVVILTAD